MEEQCHEVCPVWLVYTVEFIYMDYWIIRFGILNGDSISNLPTYN